MFRWWVDAESTAGTVTLSRVTAAMGIKDLFLIEISSCRP
jgi:hypothetical protein